MIHSRIFNKVVNVLCWQATYCVTPLAVVRQATKTFNLEGLKLHVVDYLMPFFLQWRSCVLPHAVQLWMGQTTHAGSNRDPTQWRDTSHDDLRYSIVAGQWQWRESACLQAEFLRGHPLCEGRRPPHPRTAARHFQQDCEWSVFFG